MNKVKVLLLSGCSHCDTLIKELDILKIKYESIDADDNSILADDVERLIKTSAYPILILEQPPITTFLFRATDTPELGLNFIDHHMNRLGCSNVGAMVGFLQTLLKQ